MKNFFTLAVVSTLLLVCNNQIGANGEKGLGASGKQAALSPAPASVAPHVPSIAAVTTATTSTAGKGLESTDVSDLGGISEEDLAQALEQALDGDESDISVEEGEEIEVDDDEGDDTGDDFD